MLQRVSRAGLQLGMASAHKLDLTSVWHRTPAPPALLLLHTMRKQTAAKWNPSNESIVASVAAAEGDVKIYNLETTRVGPPRMNVLAYSYMTCWYCMRKAVPALIAVDRHQMHVI